MGRPARGFKAQFIPEPHGAFIAFHHRIKLHGLIAQFNGHLLRMRAHGRGHTSPLEAPATIVSSRWLARPPNFWGSFPVPLSFVLAHKIGFYFVVLMARIIFQILSFFELFEVDLILRTAAGFLCLHEILPGNKKDPVVIELN